jgi:uncharacterized protein YigA (DUF484 family)
MTEAIEIIEKQLQEVRNKIQGSRTRLEKLDENQQSEESVIEALKERELNLVSALNKLRN